MGTTAARPTAAGRGQPLRHLSAPGRGSPGRRHRGHARRQRPIPRQLDPLRPATGTQPRHHGRRRRDGPRAARRRPRPGRMAGGRRRARRTPERKAGYGPTFDAIVLLHREQATLALERLAAEPDEPAPSKWITWIWLHWHVALRAEAAVLAQDPHAPSQLAAASAVVAGNPIATAIVQRAEALLGQDQTNPRHRGHIRCRWLPLPGRQNPDPRRRRGGRARRVGADRPRSRPARDHATSRHEHMKLEDRPCPSHPTGENGKRPWPGVLTSFGALGSSSCAGIARSPPGRQPSTRPDLRHDKRPALRPRSAIGP